MVRKTLRKILNRTVKPLLLKYIKTDRRYRYGSLDLLIRPGIFHPRFFNSTSALLSYLKKIDLKGKSLLDLGTGSGILAIFAASKGAFVTATDISQKAVDNSVYNANLNSLNINIFQSDLFDNIKHEKYEIILINPPYYPKKPLRTSDYAWYCGEKFEYYHKLFKQIRPYLQTNCRVVMSLANTCDTQKIQDIAETYGFTLELLEQKNYIWEKQFTFGIIEK